MSVDLYVWDFFFPPCDLGGNHSDTQKQENLDELCVFILGAEASSPKSQDIVELDEKLVGNNS